MDDADLAQQVQERTGAVSQNGWKVLLSQDETRAWALPDSPVVLPLRPGPGGLVLAHFALWFHLTVEPLGSGIDDHGWSPRKIGGTDVWSNHASATAVDLNALKHPQGQRGTFTDEQSERIRQRIKRQYNDLLRWGGDFSTTVDEMHFEIDSGYIPIANLAQRLRHTQIGEALLAANN